MMIMKSFFLFWTTVVLTVTSIKALPLANKRSGTAWNYWQNKAWGPNLGNWLILERWMGSEVFDQAGSNAQDEWTFSANVPNAATLLQQHWDSWVTEDDFKTLASVKVNHIRIPVGFWAFITPDQGEPYVSTGQKAQIERILGYCATYQIYAIIDLHGLPGSQNGEDHSGHIGNKDFFTTYNINRSLQTVQAVVDWMNGLDSQLKNQIAGIESANEPRPDNDSDNAMLRDYYQRAYNIIAASAFKVPMIFHDAFKGPSYWSDFLPAPANAVLDLHPYWAFSSTSDQTTILNQVCDKLTGDNNFHLPVLYGEWSLGSAVSSSDSWLRQFMDTQVSVYQKGNAAGAVMWALKNSINSDVWSFEQLIKEGYINDGTFSLHTNAKC
ncbi:glycoside hydrolase superfamily [Halteromyces radiatus]|uniref:glycoside hydrolase superfamily n=1 Tax=Halteromyces radiatus TaxID=101107 RepID=UPI00221F3058|nr:glycoside hydrolase superfamily [Halteromyces radiatus]KAI8099980.1 glycoside hydrolase superfamily [Halteromyces radiatus]